MEVFRSVAEMRRIRGQASGSVGLVPTMGFLHEGHLSLVRQARMENGAVVASIFVNPTQFGPTEGYAAYPQDTERDLGLLQKEKTDIVFMPSVDEMYPPGFNSWVRVEGITERLEGACRPSHFQGVATVVAKLFNIVEPDRAYFGQKDAQQAVVIRRMVTDLNMNLEVVILPTVREEDGLAMSSRNVFLNPEMRRAATVLFRVLKHAQGLFNEGEKDADRLRQEMTSIIRREPFAKIEYVSVADQYTLEELSTLNRPALASLAVRIGKVRLIDNILL